MRAIVFQQYVVADRIHQRAQCRGIAHAFLAPQKYKDAGKGFLSDVLYRISGVQPGTKLQVNQFTEVKYKVLLSAAIALAQTVEVSVIELLELQAIILKIKCFPAQTSNTQWQNYTSRGGNRSKLSEMRQSMAGL